MSEYNHHATFPICTSILTHTVEIKDKDKSADVAQCPLKSSYTRYTEDISFWQSFPYSSLLCPVPNDFLKLK